MTNQYSDWMEEQEIPENFDLKPSPYFILTLLVLLFSVVMVCFGTFFLIKTL